MTNSGEARVSPDRVSRFIKLLAEDQQFTSIEIAETLWLATQMEPAMEFVPEVSGQAVLMMALCLLIQQGAYPLASRLLQDNFRHQQPSRSDARQPEREVEDDQLRSFPESNPRANIATPIPQAGVLPPQTLPVWLADPAMLTDALAIIRALKPLLQKVDAGIGKRLDEPATVENIARTRLCLPILKPEQEPWFDIILVVDRGSSMHIWQRLVKDVVRILRRYGAFRDVQVFDLVVDPAEQPNEKAIQLISKPERPSHRPSELIDQRGHRIAIVLSDCAGTYWWDGTLLPMLQDWGKIMPTVLWQMLPAWMWERTALGRGTTVAISNDIPGAANQQLQTRIQAYDEPEDAKHRIPVPVVTSDVEDLARWSLMVAGDRREITPGFLLPQRGGSVPRSRGLEDIARDRAQQTLDDSSNIDSDAAFNAVLEAALEAIAHERVDRFLELASPLAQRLIMLLAAAPVITLPVMRLIRDAMLYDAQSPLPVAEVFLSGLILRLPGQSDEKLEQVIHAEHEQEQSSLDEQAVELEEDRSEQIQLYRQDLVQYDFAPHVRQVLLKKLPSVDTIEVINSVSAAVERRWNLVSDEDFQAFLTNPNVKVSEELAGLRSFASVTADILERLDGDEYTEFIQRLRAGAGDEPQSPIQPGEHDFPLEDLGYEVASLIDFPPLQSCEYESATITAILDRFEFETACFAAFPESLQNISAYQKLLENYLLTVFPTESELDQFLMRAFDFEIGVSEPFASMWLMTPDLRQKVAAIVNDVCVSGRLEILVDRLCEQNPQARSVLRAGEIFHRRAITWGYTEILKTETGEEIGLDMIAIPGGSFTMGAPESEPESEDNERPQHEVTLQPFYLGRYPITQAQWRVVAGYDRSNRDLDPDPSNFKGDNRPVEQVSWEDAREFCQRLSAKTGKDYRLPSEAQWEYACRAGTTTPFHFGETIAPELANYYSEESYNGGQTSKSRGQIMDVGSFPANDWGLCDMHGNVLEWCEDDYHSSYSGAPSNGSAWIESVGEASPKENRTDRNKPLRGGSWYDIPQHCRSAVRGNFSGVDCNYNVGFRVCCVPPFA